MLKGWNDSNPLIYTHSIKLSYRILTNASLFMLGIKNEWFWYYTTLQPTKVCCVRYFSVSSQSLMVEALCPFAWMPMIMWFLKAAKSNWKSQRGSDIPINQSLGRLLYLNLTRQRTCEKHVLSLSTQAQGVRRSRPHRNRFKWRGFPSVPLLTCLPNWRA